MNPLIIIITSSICHEHNLWSRNECIPGTKTPKLPKRVSFDSPKDTQAIALLQTFFRAKAQPSANLLQTPRLDSTPPRLPPITHATRRTRKRRRDIQTRVLREKVPRPQKHRHGFRRHDAVILRSGKMRDAEGVPHHNVGVVDAGVGGGCDPGWEACEGRCQF